MHPASCAAFRAVAARRRQCVDLDPRPLDWADEHGTRLTPEGVAHRTCCPKSREHTGDPHALTPSVHVDLRLRVRTAFNRHRQQRRRREDHRPFGPVSHTQGVPTYPADPTPSLAAAHPNRDRQNVEATTRKPQHIGATRRKAKQDRLRHAHGLPRAEAGHAIVVGRGA
jgi:hypothetical protein